MRGIWVPMISGLYSLVSTVGGLVAFIVGLGLFESLLARNFMPTVHWFRLAPLLGCVGGAIMLLVALWTGEVLYALYSPAPVLWGALQISLARACLGQSKAWLVLRLLPSTVQLVVTLTLLLVPRHADRDGGAMRHPARVQHHHRPGLALEPSRCGDCGY